MGKGDEKQNFREKKEKAERKLKEMRQNEAMYKRSMTNDKFALMHKIVKDEKWNSMEVYTKGQGLHYLINNSKMGEIEKKTWQKEIAKWKSLKQRKIHYYKLHTELSGRVKYLRDKKKAKKFDKVKQDHYKNPRTVNARKLRRYASFG